MKMTTREELGLPWDGECARCGEVQYVPDALEFNDGDLCWECLNQTHGPLVEACEAALHYFDGNAGIDTGLEAIAKLRAAIEKAMVGHA